MRSAFFLALALMLAVALPARAQDVDPETGLVREPGWESVKAHCTVCHSASLVIQQRIDRDSWLRLIRWMQETQNLWPIPEETETTILDYLAANYPPSSKRRRAPLPASMRPGRPAIDPQASCETVPMESP